MRARCSRYTRTYVRVACAMHHTIIRVLRSIVSSPCPLAFLLLLHVVILVSIGAKLATVQTRHRRTGRHGAMYFGVSILFLPLRPPTRALLPRSHAVMQKAGWLRYRSVSAPVLFCSSPCQLFVPRPFCSFQGTPFELPVIDLYCTWFDLYAYVHSHMQMIRCTAYTYVSLHLNLNWRSHILHDVAAEMCIKGVVAKRGEQLGLKKRLFAAAAMIGNPPCPCCKSVARSGSINVASACS